MQPECYAEANCMKSCVWCLVRGRTESGDDAQPAAKVPRADVADIIEVKPECTTPKPGTSRQQR